MSQLHQALKVPPRNRRASPKTQKKKGKWSEKESAESSESSSSSSSESDQEDEKKELKEALRKIEKDSLEGRQKLLQGDRKRKYNTTYEDKPLTEAEQEAYKLTAIHSADPMASYMHEKMEKKARKEK
ncbi:hypothetical protein TELCIR_04254 [Teladorsagia circumcincta]|uniref:Uncharacterized protein n=1 Tax=Teladorsagia circumcincta TaxID=45464 RepID=A0A2G9UU41_TELCI|nr:hypothetical protein TELCIR_04254 [Teladorsagia circumcincta]